MDGVGSRERLLSGDSTYGEGKKAEWGGGRALTCGTIAKEAQSTLQGSQELGWPFRVVPNGVKGDRLVSPHQSVVWLQATAKRT